MSVIKNTCTLYGSNIPKVSVIVPVYNTGSNASLCIDSLSKQTFKDFEAIFVDDGSSEANFEILQQLLMRSQLRYTLIRQPNGGTSRARNTGLRQAQGQYVCCVDSDDVLAQEYLECLYFNIKTSEAPVALCDYTILSRQPKDSKQFAKRISNPKTLNETQTGGGIRCMNLKQFKICFSSER